MAYQLGGGAARCDPLFSFPLCIRYVRCQAINMLCGLHQSSTKMAFRPAGSVTLEHDAAAVGDERTDR